MNVGSGMLKDKGSSCPLRGGMAVTPHLSCHLVLLDLNVSSKKILVDIFLDLARFVYGGRHSSRGTLFSIGFCSDY